MSLDLGHKIQSTTLKAAGMIQPSALRHQLTKTERATHSRICRDPLSATLEKSGSCLLLAPHPWSLQSSSEAEILGLRG